MAEPEQMACTIQRDETNPDETIVLLQNLSAFSEYSHTVLRALDEQTEDQHQLIERENGPQFSNHLNNPANSS